jgi:hypothetical protein
VSILCSLPLETFPSFTMMTCADTAFRHSAKFSLGLNASIRLCSATARQAERGGYIGLFKKKHCIANFWAKN